MLLSDVCLSVAYIGPNSRTERPRKTKIGTDTRNSDSTFKSKGQRSRSPGRSFLFKRPIFGDDQSKLGFPKISQRRILGLPVQDFYKPDVIQPSVSNTEVRVIQIFCEIN